MKTNTKILTYKQFAVNNGDRILHDAYNDYFHEKKGKEWHDKALLCLNCPQYKYGKCSSVINDDSMVAFALYVSQGFI